MVGRDPTLWCFCCARAPGTKRRRIRRDERGEAEVEEEEEEEE